MSGLPGAVEGYGLLIFLVCLQDFLLRKHFTHGACYGVLRKDSVLAWCIALNDQQPPPFGTKRLRIQTPKVHCTFFADRN